MRIAIVGGGPAGACLAIALRKYGLNPTVFEKRLIRTRPFAESTSALLFEMLRQLELSPPDGVAEPSSGTISRWGSEDIRQDDGFLDPRGHKWILYRNQFDNWLLGEAAARGAVIHSGTVVEKVTRANSEWILKCKQDLLTFDFLVLATGRTAGLYQQLGIQRFHADREIACWGLGSQKHPGRADRRVLVESVASGFCYSVVLNSGNIFFAVHTDSDIAGRKNTACLVPEDSLTAARLRHYQISHSGREVASTCISRNAAGENWACIGDALIATDPLSASGVYRAIEQGFSLARHLTTQTYEPRQYCNEAEFEFEKFLRLRQDYYSMETRFAGPFWKRRHSMLGPSLIADASTIGIPSA